MISIVTISMNQGRFLPTAVDSVLSQRGVDVEYVIVDAGSTDGSREYLATLRDPRVRLVLEPDRGPADGLNKGIRCTSGGVIGYLNADDAYLEGAFSAVDDLFRREPWADVVYGNGWIIDAEDRVLRHFESTPWGLRRYLFGGVNVLQQSTFLRRAAFDRTDGFNILNETCWDGEMLVDLARVGARFRHVRTDWAAFRVHAEGISGSGRLEARYREDRRRFVARAMGRGPSLTDPVLGLGARGAKLLRSPGYGLRRLRSRSEAGSRIEREPHGYVVRSDLVRT
ncbi:MAG: glycosyltransferase family 2 protein [Candidatus Nanopelagicales bacterium]|nr:glycosyltransferase family 2 protein [Candidatus Nanopelagicales bacterium]